MLSTSEPDRPNTPLMRHTCIYTVKSPPPFPPYGPKIFPLFVINPIYYPPNSPIFRKLRDDSLSFLDIDVYNRLMSTVSAMHTCGIIFSIRELICHLDGIDNCSRTKYYLFDSCVATVEQLMESTASFSSIEPCCKMAAISARLTLPAKLICSIQYSRKFLVYMYNCIYAILRVYPVILWQ